jgi:WD40 repeat protein
MSMSRQDVDRHRARYLAAASLAETRSGNPERGLLLALEALAEPPGVPEPEAAAALTAARAQRRSAGTVTRYEFGASVFAAFSAAGDRVASISWAGIGRISDVSMGLDVATFHGPMSTKATPAAAVAFSADGAYVSFAWKDGTVHAWDAGTGVEIAALATGAEAISTMAIGASGTDLLCTAMGAEACLWDLTARSARAVLRGHDAPISHVAFSANGRFLATASEDGTARVYDCRSGALVAVLAGHAGNVGHVAFSTDGARIVTSSADTTARIWRIESSASPIVLRGHEANVCSGGFSPDQRQVVTASNDATARLWDAETGVQTVVLRGHEDRVLGVSFNPAGSHVATRSHDGTARLWDRTAGTQLAMLADECPSRVRQNRPVHTAAFSRDGRLIITTPEDGTVRLWHTEPAVEEMTVLRGHLADLRNAAFSPDEQRVVTASRDGTARLWDASTGAQLVVLRGHTWPLIHAGFSPDGSRVLTEAFDGTPRLWDSATGREIAVLLSEAGASGSPVFSADGAWASAHTEDGITPIWEATSGRRVATLRGHQGPVWDVAFSPENSRIVTASVDGTARVWDVASGATLAVMRGHTGPITKARFSPDGKRVLTVSGDGFGPMAAADGTARLWNADTDAELAVLCPRGTIFDREGKVSDGEFSPDGQRVVTLGWLGGTIALWDATTGRAVAQLEGKPLRTTLPVFSPDAARVVAAATPTTKILDSKTGKALTLASEGEGQTPVAFSPDGTRFLTVSDDGSMQLHDALTGSVLAELRGHTSRVSTACFSRDGTRILTSSYDKTARIWDADPIRHSVEYIRATLCRELTRKERTRFHLADAPVLDHTLERSDDPADTYVRICDEAIADPDDPMRTVHGVPARDVHGMLGVASNPDDASRGVHWLGRAAAQGNPRAHEMLAECYERGLGVPLDRERAYVHWGIAARRLRGADDEARSIRARERQGMLGRRLRPAVAVARWQEVRDWQPEPAT